MHSLHYHVSIEFDALGPAHVIPLLAILGHGDSLSQILYVIRRGEILDSLKERHLGILHIDTLRKNTYGDIVQVGEATEPILILIERLGHLGPL